MFDISIITPVKNGATTIRDCIESVRMQSIKSEQIIVDGCSTDGTLKVIEGCATKAVKVVSEPDGGVYEAMNKGISLAGGEIIGVLNADDFYATPHVLAMVADAFADNSTDACYGDLVYVTENLESGIGNRGYLHKTQDFKVTRYWEAGRFNPDKFYWGWMPPHPTFFVRKRVYETFGMFNPALGSSADYELMLRFLVRYRISTVYLPEVLVRMRTGGMSNASLANRLKANRKDRMAWEVNGLKPFPWTLIMKPLSKISQYFRKP